MNPVKLFGGMLLVLGVCGMLLGSAMVPVSAPIWADEGIPGLHTCAGDLPCRVSDPNNICKLINNNGVISCGGGCDTSKPECVDCECVDVDPHQDIWQCECY